MSDLVALAVIAGDNCFEQGIEKMLMSCTKQIDGIYISFNGKDEMVLEKLKEIVPIHAETGMVAQVPWEDDFSLARNHSFHLVPKDDFQWIFWLDCDDILPEGVILQDIINSTRANLAHFAFMNYEYLSDESNMLVSHLKERLFRSDISWRWIYPIHENCEGPVGTRHYIAEHERYGSIKHVGHGLDRDDKRERNRKMIADWIEEEPGNLRAIQMAAHALFVEAELRMAAGKKDYRDIAKNSLRYYNQFVEHTQPDDDAYIANIQCGRLLRMLDEPSKAIDIFLQGVKLRPKWASCYCEIAQTYVQYGHSKLAIQWADVTMNATEIPENSFAPIEPLDLRYRPLMIQGAAHMELGQFDDARKVFQEANHIRDDQFTKDSIRRAVEAASKQQVLKYIDPEWTRLANWSAKPDQSICFVTRPHVEPWDATTLEEDGLGGTETCIIRLAQQFARDGWRVVIFGTPPQERPDEDGIEWYESRRWHPDEKFTVTVAVRMPELFDADIKSPTKFLWLHDVNMGDVRLGGETDDRFARPDVIVVPSVWHMNHLRQVYRLNQHGDDPVADVEVIENGVEISRYRVNEPENQRVLNRFIYASSPDRGLARVLDFWPKIRELIPSAELKIFYGWNNIDKLIEMNSPQAPALIDFKATIKRRISQLEGIEWVGRISEDQLAREMKAAGMMLYPAMFMDTFGIVFHQSLVAGCLPLTAATGALRSHLPPKLVVAGADANSEIFEKMFIERLMEVWNMEMDSRIMLTEGHASRVQALEWDKVYTYWRAAIERAQNPIKVVQA